MPKTTRKTAKRGRTVAATGDKNIVAVECALAIFQAFSKHGKPLSFAALMQVSGFKRAALKPLLEMLERAGYIQSLDDGRYEIGLAVLSLAASYRHSAQPAEFVITTLQRLVELSKESATFYVPDGDERVCVYRVNSTHANRDYVRIGMRLPLKYGAGGHVLTAFSGAPENRFRRVRQRYLATSLGEIEPGGASVAVPIFAPGKKLFGALILSGPRDRFSAEVVEGFETLLLKHAAELTLKLGGDATGLMRALERHQTRRG